MSWFQAFILGIVQGLTEFLPISSSGHLKLGQILFGLEDLGQYLAFDLACHLGTLAVVFYMLFPEIGRLTKKKVYRLALATLPLVPVALLLGPIKGVIENPAYLGSFFLLSSLILFAGDYWGKDRGTEWGWTSSFAVGVSQAFAVLPGVSRAGSTIATARLLGWSKRDAAVFSALLAIPTILGGAVLIVKDLNSSTPLSLELCLVGGVTSFFAGILSLKLLFHLMKTGRFRGYAFYCAILGLLSWCYL